MTDVLKWVPGEWVRPDSYAGYPWYYIKQAISFVTGVAFAVAVVPAVVLAIIGVAAIALAAAMLFALFLLGMGFSQNLVSVDQYDYLKVKHGGDDA